MSSPTADPCSRRTALCVTALLALFTVLAVAQAWFKSETYDEPMYIYTGYSYVRTGDLSLNREHPPLSKYLIGLPLLALDLVLPADYQQRPGNPLAFYARQPNVSPHEMLFLARLPGVLLGVVLGLYVYRWARLAFGTTAGLAALLLYALSPNMLGYAPVAGNDFCATLFCFATVYHVWRWLETGARASLALGAIMLGLALGSKLTALMLLPVLGLTVAAAAWRRRRPALLGWASVALCASLGVLWLLYGGEARSLADARQHVRFALPDTSGAVFGASKVERGLQGIFGDDTPVPLLSFLKGIDHQREMAKEGRSNYFHGKNSESGSPVFFVATFLIKNPEGLVLLLLLGVVSLRRTGRGVLHEALLAGFPLLLLVVFSASSVQLGFKYVLQVMPFVCVAASRVLAVDREGRPAVASRSEAFNGAVLMIAFALAMFFGVKDADELRHGYWLPLLLTIVCAARLRWPRTNPDGRIAPHACAGLLLVWASASSLLQQPDNLMYFNHWVGGPERGWTWSVIGDDWGQDTSGLSRWMADNGISTMHYDYYGEGDPDAWGMRTTPCWGGVKGYVPPEDLVAVHVNLMMRQPKDYAWLAGHQPIAKIGHTIFIYDFRPPPS